MLRSLQCQAIWAAALCAALALGCGGGQTPEAQAGGGRDEERAQSLLERARASKDLERYRRLVSRFPDSRAAGDGRDELAALLIAEGNRALKEEDFSTADDRAEEARLYAGVELTEKARAVHKAVDEGRAARITKKATDVANAGKCASALKLVADPLRAKPRPHFKRELLRLTQDSLVNCLSQRVVQEAKSGNVEGARAELATPDVALSLTKESFGKVQVVLEKYLVEQSTSEIKPMLAQQKFAEAFAKLRELKQAGKLSDREHGVAVGLVREAIRAHVLELGKSAISSPKPSEGAKKIDAAIAAASWDKLPDDLAEVKTKVAVAIECERLRCKLGKPTAAWAWGTIAVRPPASAQAEESGKLGHAQKVWVLGKGAAHTLIATSDPGAAEGPALFDKASGWVDAKNLKPIDTTLWLPPNDQLVGVMVWAPLRAPSKDYHLGTVKKIDGKKATVERMGDKAEVSVDIGTLRAGKFSSGLRVMAFCVDQVHTEPAKVDSVVSSEGGVPKVKIACEKGDIQRVEVASALSTKAEWLPPKKP